MLSNKICDLHWRSCEINQIIFYNTNQHKFSIVTKNSI